MTKKKKSRYGFEVHKFRHISQIYSMHIDIETFNQIIPILLKRLDIYLIYELN